MSIEFDEKQLENLNEIGQKLFNNEQDPRSITYIRKLKRPKIDWLKVGALILLPPVLFIIFGWLLYYCGISMIQSFLIAMMIWLIYLGVALKSILLWLVKIYQRYAPDSIRKKCRFEPSCSEYMMLSIEKYGVWKGVRKGIDRLKRCNVNNGGFDFP